MSADSLFQIVNTSVLPGWLLLAFLPRWRHTQFLVFGVLIPLLALVYAILLIGAFTSGSGFDFSDFSSLEGVQALLGNPMGLVLGWTHYLAFDLFVGAWIVRDSQRSQVPHILVLLPLFLTLMAGPLGLIIYLAIRQIRRRELVIKPDNP